MSSVLWLVMSPLLLAINLLISLVAPHAAPSTKHHRDFHRKGGHSNSTRGRPQRSKRRGSIDYISYRLDRIRYNQMKNDHCHMAPSKQDLISSQWHHDSYGHERHTKKARKLFDMARHGKKWPHNTYGHERQARKPSNLFNLAGSRSETVGTTNIPRTTYGAHRLITRSVADYGNICEVRIWQPRATATASRTWQTVFRIPAPGLVAILQSLRHLEGVDPDSYRCSIQLNCMLQRYESVGRVDSSSSACGQQRCELIEAESSSSECPDLVVITSASAACPSLDTPRYC